jgi:hypothetical protein
MKLRGMISLCLLAVALSSSCRMAEVLIGNERAGTVDRLWSDVPPVAGAQKADLAIPLGARLLIRAAMQGRVSFIAFTSDRKAQDVQDFYTRERMKAAGWTAAEEGCVSDSESEEAQGAVCFFTRKDGRKEEGLAIIVAEDPEKKETHIFYARIDATPDTKSSESSDRVSRTDQERKRSFH